MKNKLLAIVLFIVLLLVLFYFQNTKHTQSKLVVQSMGDRKGIFIGEKSKAMIEQEEHNKVLRTIDEAEENIRNGNSYYKTEKYEEAAQEYGKAYSIDKGGRAVSGLKLAMTYEKLDRYDEGIALLDQMIQNGELSEKGIQNANVIKSRLLAAKAAQKTADVK